jgi:chemotaxis protein MotB
MSGGHDDEPHEEHEEHVNHEAWVIPYADLLTLLMAMFIALFAMSNVDKDKFKDVAISLNKALSGEDLDTGVFSQPNGTGNAAGIGSGGPAGSSDASGRVGPSDASNDTSMLQKLLTENEAVDAERDAERADFRALERELAETAVEIGVGNNLELELQERGLVVRIVTDQVLFTSGRAELTADGVQLVNAVGALIQPLEQRIIVEGHTDDRPISNEFFPSNVHLSAARAATVELALTALGFAPERVRSTGMGDSVPLVANDSEANRARNRRVEIVVQSKLAATADDRTPVDEPEVVTPDSEPGIDDIVGDISRI